MKTIVVSAVNLRKGGTLTILRQCLQYLSTLQGEYRIVALVHHKELAKYPGIEYIEIPWALKNWGYRLWCEYVTMYRISKKLGTVHLWFSLHDTTPRVLAKRRAVYMQTSFPFFRWGWMDFVFDYKIPLFALLTRFAYRINIRQNRFLVVQQQWLREGFSRMFDIRPERFIVAPPHAQENISTPTLPVTACHHFLFVSTPDCHKNFELICQAAALLEQEGGPGSFRVTLTTNGTENRYARWLYQKWGHVKSLQFEGLMNKEKLEAYYLDCDCLIFPSRIETWGLPISEFMARGKPMLLADLPYAHETAAGSRLTAFFHPQKPAELKQMMQQLIAGKNSFLKPVPCSAVAPPVAKNWESLFKILTGDD